MQQYEQSSSYTFVFTRPLQLGSVNSDVLMLQKILNSGPDTQIAYSGAGSPGLETRTFGALTKKAVIKFQNKYYADIIVPAGLVSGNGRVGPLTMKKLNSFGSLNAYNFNNNPIVGPNSSQIPFVTSTNDVLQDEKIDIYQTDKRIKTVDDSIIQKINAAISSRTALSDDIAAYTPQNIGSVLLSRLTQSAGRAGTFIVASGEGLDVNGPNTVYFGEKYVVRNLHSLDGQTLSFNVPSIPAGKYDIVVKNALGVSNSLYFVVTTASSPIVTLDQPNPSKIRYGDSITFTGSGFSSSNNKIYTTYGNYENISSPNGNTLTVTFRPEYLSEIAKGANTGGEFLVDVFVVNDNGVSAPQNFILTF